MKILRWISRRSVKLCICVSPIFFLVIYILNSHVQLQESRVDSKYLQKKLDEITREYSRIVKDEFQGGYRNTADLTQITIVLLENMSKRLQLLEQQHRKIAVDYNKLSIQNEIFGFNHSINEVLSHYTNQEICSVPNDPLYPECKTKVEWLTLNWKKDIKFSQNGVDGSLCTILKYFQEVEPFCPTKMKKNHCEIPDNPKFPKCRESVLWIINNWKSDKHYSDFGIDGTLCSILFYLSEVEAKCPPHNKTTSKFKNHCGIPNDKAYPNCQNKVDWMKNFWRSHRCYSEDFAVDGSLCSILYYLSYVETACPKQSNWSKSPRDIHTNITIPKFNIEKINLVDLLNKLDKNSAVFTWIRSRISHMFDDWYNSVLSLNNKVNISGNTRKNILIHIGVLSEEKSLHFAESTDKGGPLGELVQWSDLISSLYVLGHNIVIAANYNLFLRYLEIGEIKRPCPPLSSGKFDLIFTDYIGLKYLQKKSFSTFGFLRCKLFLLDSFGTEAQFNFGGKSPRFAWPSTGFSKTSYGSNNFKLRQFMTMFPHSPDNLFLGFVVNKEASKFTTKKKQRALVYGKHFYMWKDLKSRRFLDLIHEHFEIHATVGGGSSEEIKKYLPPYVINHGVLDSGKFRKLLRESKLFVGLGFPYEGPAALEAIAEGCIFLNPKFVPAKNQINTKFFKGKPTFRSLTSQHPYAENFIGEPHVFTVDIMDEKAMKEAIKKILETEVDPYLPFEYTHEGMLERVNAFLKYHNFCEPDRDDWPPLSSRKIYAASNGKSCKDVCLEKGLVCEPSYFKSIDIPRYFESFPCDVKEIVKRPSLVAPAYITDEKICVTQGVDNLYSCTVSDNLVQRICPCRDYRPGQVALCGSCF